MSGLNAAAPLVVPSRRADASHHPVPRIRFSVGGPVGVTVVGAVFSSVYGPRLAQLLRGTAPGSKSGRGILSEIEQAMKYVNLTGHWQGCSPATVSEERPRQAQRPPPEAAR